MMAYSAGTTKAAQLHLNDEIDMLKREVLVGATEDQVWGVGGMVPAMELRGDLTREWDRLHECFPGWSLLGKENPAIVRDRVIRALKWNESAVSIDWVARVGDLVAAWTVRASETPCLSGSASEVYSGRSGTVERHWREERRRVHDGAKPTELAWVELDPSFWETIARRVARVSVQASKAWKLLAVWAMYGAPLHYRAARRGRPRPTGRIDSNVDVSSKISELVEERGPLQGPFPTPPFRDSHILSPILGVPKGEADVRLVYHCSYPRTKRGGQPHPQRSLNGGINGADFWLNVYDRPEDLIAKWVRHWTPDTRYIVFKLDFFVGISPDPRL